VEVGVDGAWSDARLGAEIGRYAWRAWSFDWLATPGTHTLVSRAIDANGRVQPIKAERDAEIASGREDNSQWTRQIRVDL
jgi:hypothetical protein